MNLSEALYQIKTDHPTGYLVTRKLPQSLLFTQIDVFVSKDAYEQDPDGNPDNLSCVYVLSASGILKRFQQSY